MFFSPFLSSPDSHLLFSFCQIRSGIFCRSPDSGDDISEVERRETVAAINAFLKGLPQKQRDLFVRRYWYAADTAALAKMFHMTESHVRMTLSRLRKRLQKHLQKEGLL